MAVDKNRGTLGEQPKRLDQMFEKSVYFQCSPSLGILDNWLPILDRISNLSDATKLKVIIPKPATVEEIDSRNLLVSISDTIIDEVIYKGYDGGWYRARDLSTAKEALTGKRHQRSLFHLARRFEGRGVKFVASVLDVTVRLLSRLNKRGADRFSMGSIDPDHSALLYDVYEETKAYNAEINYRFRGAPRFSICHGIDINSNPITDRSSGVRVDDRLLVYLFSDAERRYYRETFGVPDNQMEVVGVPRHDRDWIERLWAMDPEDHEPGYVVLFSRSLSPYFTIERKRVALKAIYDTIVVKHGLKLLVKMHPKERGRHLFGELFGDENRGLTWDLSHLHPYVLGRRCRLALVFFSGVCVDMNALGVPVIEYLDLRGLKKFDHADALRVNGEPTFSYRHLNLVSGVSTPEQFDKTVGRALRDVRGFKEPYIKRHQELFPKEDELSSRIAQDVLGSLV